MHRTPFWWTRDETTRFTERRCQPLGLYNVGGRLIKFEYWKMMEWHRWEILCIRRKIYKSTRATIIKLHMDGRHSPVRGKPDIWQEWNDSGSGPSSGCNFSGAINLCCITDQLVNPVRARRCLCIPPPTHLVPLLFEHIIWVFFLSS